MVDASPTIREEGGREIGDFTGARHAFASLDEAVEAAHKYNPVRAKDACDTACCTTCARTRRKVALEI